MDTPNRRTSSAHVACSRSGTCPILKKIIFLESSWKIVQNIYRPAQLDEFFFKAGTPTVAMHGWNSDLINRYVVLLCIIKHLSQRIFGRIWCKGNQIQRRIGNERRISFGFWPDSQECLHRTLLIVPSHSFVHSNAKFDEYNLTI